MTLGRERMGEQPIFTCKAHVFHIDPKTKRSWMSASVNAVNVSFFYDSSRSLYRIISVDGTKAVINSTITPNMTFTKTSQKFGQWSDVRANTVYGLGFSSEAELGKFIEKFQEVKEATRKVNSNGSTPAGPGTAVTPVTSANASPITSRAALPPPADTAPQDGMLEPIGSGTVPSGNNIPPAPLDETHQRAHSVSGLQTGESPSHQAKGGGGGGDKSPYGAPGVAAASSVDMQLKYENDRLKLALAQSSANAKMWEVELATLKNNNARLTSALQESTANVDEWKRQLHSYKEENARMKAKYQAELAAAGAGATGVDEELRKELQQLRLRVEQLETELKAKNDEIKIASSNSAKVELQNLQKENVELQTTSKMAQNQLEMAITAHESQREILLTLNTQLATQIHEIANIHREISVALQT